MRIEPSPAKRGARLRFRKGDSEHIARWHPDRQSLLACCLEDSVRVCFARSRLADQAVGIARSDDRNGFS